MKVEQINVFWKTSRAIGDVASILAAAG